MPGRPVRTFLDTGVLITGYNGQPALQERALAVLEDPDRIFLSSPFVRHECCPKALFNKRHLEYRFYREYFQRAVMFNDVKLILERASREAARSGVSAMDSFHLAAAFLLGADELLTIENPRKSITARSSCRSSASTDSMKAAHHYPQAAQPHSSGNPA